MAVLHPVAPGIYAIEGLRMGRAYLIEDSDGLTLIDSSSQDVADRILNVIATIGRRPDELRTVIVTHYHYDHTGNVGRIVQRTGAAFCAHAEDVPYIDGRLPWMTPRGVPSFGRRPEPFTLRVDRAVSDGDVLPAAGGLEVIHAPGHTPGHIALYARERRVMFSGDAYMNTGGLQLPPSISTHDMKQAKRSIAQLAAYDFDVALPGHGRPIIGHASEKLAHWSRAWFGDPDGDAG
jgi:glyoxylase-like metal-dependent hydrolase (beta-lactamase superfamily II)